MKPPTPIDKREARALHDATTACKRLAEALDRFAPYCEAPLLSYAFDLRASVALASSAVRDLRDLSDDDVALLRVLDPGNVQRAEIAGVWTVVECPECGAERAYEPGEEVKP